MRRETVLTESEIEILKLGLTDPDIFTEYFLTPKGAGEGFQFDRNFVEEGKWQKKVHQAEQKDITLIGGFGTGKTFGIGMSAACWCIMTANFKFLSAAPKAWQAKLMYDLIITNTRGTRFEDFIWEKPRKPYPKIVTRFKIGDTLYESSMEFMSADKNAQGILSWEGDWLHIDEAGLIDDLEQTITNVGSRLRGSVLGRTRLGRFSMASNSWDNYYLWYYFDLAMGQPDKYLSIQSSSRHNKNVTDEQLERMVARIPKDERERFIDGGRPEGRGRYFDKQSIYACEVKGLADVVQQKVDEGVANYEYDTLYGAGVVNFKTPAKSGRLYMIFGDPGVDGAPKRNSPVLMVFDVTDFPASPANLAAFWWGNGGGRITPWIVKMFDLIKYYKPIFTGVDSTGPQKNIATLINEYAFRETFDNENDGDDIGQEAGYVSPLGMVNGIRGMDFSGSKKQTYLQALRLFIEAKLFRWPYEIAGIRSQLANYDPEKDRGVISKIVQDIVATMSMAAYAIRIWFHVDPKDLLEATSHVVDPRPKTARRSTRAGRERRAKAGRHRS